ncbi:DUF2530 domain-containing protein [Nostocoides sp. F2B08]|uniref:DUF2530 domain-containing protein n=1 Tax=Nostocoides sp. F2B08 TaxID=2653936 RepID=UPI001263BB59|nr:DUF2530 domain-containing protein [Tetrasphaera sp. F2B08]KAB7741392.1 DUF2530 domain-containing protein [Tetrasphaera sp. F2B08]
MREDSGPSSGDRPETPSATPAQGAGEGFEYPPMPVRTVTVIAVGMVAWAIALVVILAVPELRTGDRSWWPWTCVSGLVLGAIGWVYVRRGRGNAAGVE